MTSIVLNVGQYAKETWDQTKWFMGGVNAISWGAVRNMWQAYNHGPTWKKVGSRVLAGFYALTLAPALTIGGLGLALAGLSIKTAATLVFEDLIFNGLYRLLWVEGIKNGLYDKALKPFGKWFAKSIYEPFLKPAAISTYNWVLKPLFNWVVQPLFALSVMLPLGGIAGALSGPFYLNDKLSSAIPNSRLRGLVVLLTAPVTITVGALFSAIMTPIRYLVQRGKERNHEQHETILDTLKNFSAAPVLSQSNASKDLRHGLLAMIAIPMHIPTSFVVDFVKGCQDPWKLFKPNRIDNGLIRVTAKVFAVLAAPFWGSLRGAVASIVDTATYGWRVISGTPQVAKVQASTNTIYTGAYREIGKRLGNDGNKQADWINKQNHHTSRYDIKAVEETGHINVGGDRKKTEESKDTPPVTMSMGETHDTKPSEEKESKSSIPDPATDDVVTIETVKEQKLPGNVSRLSRTTSRDLRRTSSLESKEELVSSSPDPYEFKEELEESDDDLGNDTDASSRASTPRGGRR